MALCTGISNKKVRTGTITMPPPIPKIAQLDISKKFLFNIKSYMPTQPDKPKGRGQAVQFPPVKEYALTAGLEVYQPEKIKNNTEVMEKLSQIHLMFL